MAVYLVYWLCLFDNVIKNTTEKANLIILSACKKKGLNVQKYQQQINQSKIVK